MAAPAHLSREQTLHFKLKHGGTSTLSRVHILHFNLKHCSDEFERCSKAGCAAIGLLLYFCC
jgi:hypothetical protein